MRTVSDVKTCRKCGLTEKFAWKKLDGQWAFYMAQLDPITGKPLRDSKGQCIPSDIRHVCKASEDASQTSENDTAKVSRPKVTPPPVAPGTDALGAMLAAMIGPHIASKVDEAAVQKMIDEAIEAAAMERPVEITFGELPKVTIEADAHPSTKDLVSLALLGAMINVWPYLYGPPGTGKSYAAVKLAQSLGKRAFILPLGPATMPSSVFGFVKPDGTTARTHFREAWENGGVLILDELDQCAPELLTLLNGAMANNLATFPDAIIERHKDCLIVATGNTTLRGGTKGHESRRKLDVASQDRFAYLHWARDEKSEKSRLKPLTNGHTDTFADWLSKVRSHIDAHRPEIVSSQRGSVGIASAFALGPDAFSSPEIYLNAYLWRGIDSGVKDAILREHPLPAFLKAGK